MWSPYKETTSEENSFKLEEHQLFKMLLNEVRGGLAAGFCLMEATRPCLKSSFSGALGMKTGLKGEWEESGR